MRLAEILRLPKEPESLNRIQEYLKQPLSEHDYQAAFNFMLEVAYDLELYDYVILQGEELLKEISDHGKSEYEEKILKHVIHASIKVDQYEKAKHYIEIRKQILPVLKEYLGILDEIEYKKAMQLPYLDDLLKVLKDIIPDQVKIFCLKELFEIYKNDHQYEMALNSLYQLYDYDLRSIYIEEEIKLLLSLKRYDDVMKLSLEILHHQKDHLEALLALVEVYIQKEDYHKASILEAENEELIDQSTDIIKKRAYELFVLLYQKLDNKLSLDLYQKKLKSLNRVLDKKSKIEEEKKPEVVIIQKTESKEKPKKHLIRYFEIAEDLVTYSHLIDEKLALREYLRIFFMHLDQSIKTKEYALYLYDENPNFYHYKKERLYDKHLLKPQLEETIIEKIMTDGQDVFSHPKHIMYQKNIITQKPYDEDILFIYAFPLKDLGVFIIHLEEEIKDPGEYYDLFNMVTSILYGHIIDEKKVLKIKKQNQLYEHIMNSPIIAFRQLTEIRSTYNDAAQKLFQIDQHHHLELFLRDVSYQSRRHYEETIFKLFTKPNEIKEILYTYQEKHILEKLYSMRIGDEIVIMSVFFDQTKEVEETKDLIEKATVDLETGLANFYALSNEIVDELSDKASMFLIELDYSLKHIYGSNQMSLFFKEFAQHTKKFFSDGKTYRFDTHQLLVIIPTNDIRTVTKTVKDYFKFLDGYSSQILTYEKFNANMGILRYPVVTTEKNPDKLYRYLDIALEKAKREKEEKFVFFVFRDYESELFEQHVIDQLNLAIEQKSLGLIFNQITDIKKNRVWQYESELVLHNLAVDSKYLIAIAKKRNRLVDLERYHIQKICEFLVTLEKETERLIKLTIPISKETFLDPTFNAYILGIFKQYGIPYEFIRIKFDMDIRANHYAPQIQELIDLGIGIDTTSLDMALNYPFHALHLDMKKESIKYHQYLTKVKELLESFQMAVIVRGIKTKDQKDAIEKIGIQYIEGSIYKQLTATSLLEKIKETI